MPYAGQKNLGVLSRCKVTEPRKQGFKVEILYDLKEFCKIF